MKYFDFFSGLISGAALGALIILQIGAVDRYSIGVEQLDGSMTAAGFVCKFGSTFQGLCAETNSSGITIPQSIINATNGTVATAGFVTGGNAALTNSVNEASGTVTNALYYYGSNSIANLNLGTRFANLGPGGAVLWISNGVHGYWISTNVLAGTASTNLAW